MSAAYSFLIISSPNLLSGEYSFIAISVTSTQCRVLFHCHFYKIYSVLDTPLPFLSDLLNAEYSFFAIPPSSTQCRVLLHCHFSQIHSDSESKYLLASYLWVKKICKQIICIRWECWISYSSVQKLSNGMKNVIINYVHYSLALGIK